MPAHLIATICGVSAYVLWGVLPIYWKALGQVPADQILAHRIVWSFCFLLVVIAFRQELGSLKRFAGNRRIQKTLLLSGVLIAANWLIFIWGVNHGHVVECSLGYFLSPLMSVAFGIFLLGERLRFWQIISFALAAFGVAYRTIGYGSFPWLSIILAATFVSYSYVRKKVAVEALQGLAVETFWLAPFGLMYLLLCEYQGNGSFGHTSLATLTLLVGAGAVTSLPLILFGRATRELPLSTLGILQYVSPTLQFLVGFLIYQEQVNTEAWVAFIFIWIGLLIFIIDSLQNFRVRRLAA